MGSLNAATAKSEELMRWAEQLGGIVSHKAFGEDGPDLKTSLADMERLLGPILERMAAGFLQASVAEQAGRLPDESPCPTCGQECGRVTQEEARTMTSEHGDFCWREPAWHCDRCQRSFFPSADGAAD